ncbi:MAG: copper amine oxidase N-terminal domain-containing protein [Clostridiales bacterium]|jgi:hypothetical protein|nr:copper amine oxidase N-terminal domain-containing protein [Clostridiales bacterium]
MRRFANGLFLALALILTSAQMVAAFPIELDGVRADINVSVIDNRSLVPMRAFVELLGGAVDWNESARRVEVLKETPAKNLEIVLYIDNETASVNGREVALDVPATIIDDRTLVPLRFVTEALGMNVDFYDNTIFITRSHIILSHFMPAVARGNDATLSIVGHPNTRYHIGVELLAGPSTAAGLGYADSDAYGAVSWTWRIGPTTTPGFWPITITGANETLSLYFEVID